MILKVKDIAKAIEAFAPISLQESYDNCGLQVGDPEAYVSAALICLDVTEDILREAIERNCELIISHHPLIFHGLKHLTGATPTERIVAEALRRNISIYAAHTNLDSATNGVSCEMARDLHLRDCKVLLPSPADPAVGLGIVGETDPTPALEFLRRLKDTFHVRALRYSAQSQKLVVRRVALCGGAGAEFIPDAIRQKADIYVTGDIKYHNFTAFASEILLADIGHYESELVTRQLFSRLLRERLPQLLTRCAESESNPVAVL